MSVVTKLWKVADNGLVELSTSMLPSEHALEDWIENDPSLLGERLLMIGRQVRTSFGGFIDLLAIDASGAICIIELKRDQTPREATAQLLDYGSWLSKIDRDEFDQQVFQTGDETLSQKFKAFFGVDLPEVDLRKHRLLLVAPRLDDASERILTYLSDVYGVSINSVSFNVFGVDGGQILARTWLIDPSDVVRNTETAVDNGWKWTGYWYINVGEQPEAYASGVNRSWEDCKKFSMISAGQGPRWSNQLRKLKVGDPVYAYLNQRGYVGYGIVRSEAVMASEYIPPNYTLPITQLNPAGSALLANSDDAELADYVVGIDWKSTREKDSAVHYKGIFAIQFVVCRLSDPSTLKTLEKEFAVFSQGVTSS